MSGKLPMRAGGEMEAPEDDDEEEDPGPKGSPKLSWLPLNPHPFVDAEDKRLAAAEAPLPVLVTDGGLGRAPFGWASLT